MFAATTQPRTTRVSPDVTTTVITGTLSFPPIYGMLEIDITVINIRQAKL